LGELFDGLHASVFLHGPTRNAKDPIRCTGWGPRA